MVAVLVPLAHAAGERTAADGARTETHIHAPGQDCPPPHDQDHCPACQTAGIKTLPCQAAPAATATATHALALALGHTFSLPRHPVRTPGPRGPPIA